MIFYDLETTSLYNAKIIEIAAYDSINDTYFHELVHPDCVIPPESIAIHHITNAKVKDCPVIKEILPRFVTFCGINNILVAHNNDRFDKIVLQAEFITNDLQIPDWTFVDTLKIARTLLPNLQSHKLDMLKNHYNINIGTAHHALDDVKNMYQIYLQIKQDKTDDEMIKISNEYIIKHIPFGKYKGTKISELPLNYIDWLLNNLDKERNEDLLKSLYLSKNEISI